MNNLLIPNWLSTDTNTKSHQPIDMIEVYHDLGWKLIPIPKGSKAPTHKGWNIEANCKLPDGHTGNVGLALAYSGIVSIDIDHWLKASQWLKAKGISLDNLYNAPNAVKIISGRQGSAKLLYRLPAGIQPLVSQKINDDGTCILELRCATSSALTVQDVLPPSIHPDTGKPYQWGEHNDLFDYLSNMPELPTELLNLWNELITPPAPIEPPARTLNADWQTIKQALDCIPADCSRDEWIKTAMALHHACVLSNEPDTGFNLWDSWSSTAPTKYKGISDLQHQWRSFKTDKANTIKLGTLFHIAREYGYTKDIDIDGLFSNIKQNSSNDLSINWMGKYMLSEKELASIEETKWVYEDLIPSSHIVTIAAEPNAGKTTILFHIACQLSQDGYEVIYVNADLSGGDAKYYVSRAVESGVSLLLPDMKIGQSMENVVKDITSLNDSDSKFNNQIFFFDTLKKMADVISKNKIKSLLKTLRGLSAKGATVVLLAHTNKYSDRDTGSPIYEGTGDIRADSDELIYFIPVKNPDGSITVSTEVLKQRKQIKPITFNISADREVTRVGEYINTRDIATTKKHLKDDKPIIESITRLIKSNCRKQIDIINQCKLEDISARQSRRVLQDYAKGNSPIPLWETETSDRNTLIYSLVNDKPIEDYFDRVGS